jgi:biotin-dependent carboxylase-like uncharacterized protein
MIVQAAHGFATVQDFGWPRGRAIGLPRSGALDPDALAVANVLVGNRAGAAGLEIALGDFALRFDQPATVALTGARPAAELDGEPLPLDTTVGVARGARIRIGAGAVGRFSYLAIRGGLDVPPVLGARCTYPPTALGGLSGRRLEPGDRLRAGDQIEGAAPPPGFRAPPLLWAAGPIAVIPGPQANLFSPATWAAFEAAAYTVSPRSDRMGTRLAGPPLQPEVPARLPSEATCIGAIQVPDDGQPIVILADGPTVGGYPKLGAVAGVDVARLVQSPIGSSIRFVWTTVAEAQAALYRARARLAQRLAAIRSGAG